MRLKIKLKLAIVGTKGVSLAYRNSEVQTDYLVKYLSEFYAVTVFCANVDSKSKIINNSYFKAHLIHFTTKWIQNSLFWYSTLAFIRALFFADVILVFGTSAAWLFPLVKKITNKRIIVQLNQIDWHIGKKNRIQKWIYFYLESLALKYSHADISGNEVIQDYISQKYGTLNNLVDFGANHSKSISKDTFNRMYPFLSDSYAFMNLNIHSDSMIKTVLSAFDIEGKKKLVVLGNWNDSDYGKYLKSKYASSSNIFLLEPIYNQEKLDLLQSNASVFIQCKTTNLTNTSLLEAMYCGVSVLAFNNAYNRVITEDLALYFQDKLELIDLLKSMSWSDFESLGSELQKIAQKKYTWQHTVSQYNMIIEKAFLTKNKLSAIPLSTTLNYKSLLELGHAHLKSIHTIKYI